MQNAPVLDLLTFGESMVLFAAQDAGPLALAQRYTRHLAGAESNVAIGVARLGLRAGWLSRLGCDGFGDFVLDGIAAEGVACHVARDAARPTGFMLKSRALQGDPEVQYYRRGSAASALSLADFDEALFASARHLHVTGITAALSESAAGLLAHAMRFMRARGRSVSFDPNLRPALWPSREHMVAGINRLAALADCVMPGLQEGCVLTGCDRPEDIAAFYLAQGAQCVVVKLGAEGAFFGTRDECGLVPGVAVREVIDTVGAGDGFAAGVLSARLEGLPWRDALARGNRIGALALSSRGDMEALPRRHQLQLLSPPESCSS
jgi:sugar/nucleoside kinase (ribokinase family)